MKTELPIKGDLVKCPACGDNTARYDGWSVDRYVCGCGGIRMTAAEVERLILEEGLLLSDVIDAVCKLNGFVGVGYLTFGDQIGDYIKDKSRKGFSVERFMNE